MIKTVTSNNPRHSASAQRNRSRQVVIFGGGALVILLLALGVAKLADNNDQIKPKVIAEDPLPRSKPIVTGGSAFSDQRAWQAGMSAEVQALRKQLDEYKQGESEARKRKEEDSNPKSLASGTAVGAPPDMASIFAPPPPPGGVTGSKVSTLLTSPSNNTSSQLAPPLPSDVQAKVSIGAIRFEDEIQVAAAKTAATAKTIKPDVSGGLDIAKTAGSYIPAGSFMRVVVLSGADAPTGGQAQQNPTPILMKVLDPVTMSNGHKADLKGCVVTGNAVGSVSSERAEIRIDRLSCINQDGGAIDLAVKGYVAGEDGAAGMRGKLVSKSGQILANGLLASVGSGIGAAFSGSATTQTTTPLGGQIQSTTPGKEFQAGFGKGVEKSFDRLATYYIQLAEKIFPVVSVQAGRVVDVVFSRGFTLEPEDEPPKEKS